MDAFKNKYRVLKRAENPQSFFDWIFDDLVEGIKPISHDTRLIKLKDGRMYILKRVRKSKLNKKRLLRTNYTNVDYLCQSNYNKLVKVFYQTYIYPLRLKKFPT